MPAYMRLAGFALAILHTLVAATPEKATAPKRFKMSKVSSREQAEASLLGALAGTFREGRTKDHIMEIKEKLMPMFKAAPQYEDGTLSHGVVRYVLHRFFKQDRGWEVRGLEPHATGENKANATLGAVQDWVPMYLYEFLEQLQAGEGMGAEELAVVAATLEDLVRKEALENVVKILNQHRTSIFSNETYSETTVNEVLETYMVRALRGGANSSMESRHGAKAQYIAMNQDWPNLSKWIHDLHAELMPSGSANESEIKTTVEAMGERYTTYHDRQCADMKSDLLELESKTPARVRLHDFYKNRPASLFAFRESLDYLKALGAVDMSDPKDPRVIIPNYMTGRSNCKMVSKLYGVCCRNECETLTVKLEDEIGGEVAYPEQILELVAQLPSATVEAPRALSSALQDRLYAIARNNDGYVPLHGRLFAQWMHHAFPRECPFPHEQGSIKPQTPEEWMQETKKGAILTLKQVEDSLRQDYENGIKDQPMGAEARHHHHSDENELQWTDSEDLLLPVKVQKKASTLRVIIVFVTLSSMAYAVKKLLWDVDKSTSLPQFISGKSKLV